MAQVAQMYYIDGYNQDKIAKQFSLSRSSISFILADARQYGIVNISVKNPKNYNQDLSREFINRFGLTECYVIPTSVSSLSILTKIVATHGASITENQLISNSIIGVAWGTTMYEFMLSFNNTHNINDVNIVPLIGGTNHVSSEFQLNEMVRNLASKLNGSPTFIYAPAYAVSVGDRELYMQSQTMQDIASKWTHLDVAIVSVGSMPEYYENNLLFDNKALFDPFVIKTLFEQDESRAVGDICGRRFNVKGQFLNCDHNQKLIAIGENDMRNLNKVICVAAGNHKILSIIGALRTEVLDVLITDENTARAVLEVASI
jgi:DNA-binding transcriptional regulator LsrR (DeoR family)